MLSKLTIICGIQILIFSFVITQSQIKSGKWRVKSGNHNSATVSKRDKFSCIAKCDREGALLAAAVDVDSNCFCDDFSLNGLNANRTHMYRAGQSLEERTLIFIPFISTTQYISYQTDSLVVHITGSPMQFSADGPAGYLQQDKKAIELLMTDSTGIKYSIPNHLKTRIESEGAIMSFWLRLTSSAIEKMDLVGLFGDVYIQNALVHHKPYLMQERSHNPNDMEWHFYTVVYDQTSKIVNFTMDSTHFHTQSYDGVLNNTRDELEIGRRLEPNCNANFFCFMVQSTAGKNAAHVQLMAQEAMKACDDVIVMT